MTGPWERYAAPAAVPTAPVGGSPNPSAANPASRYAGAARRLPVEAPAEPYLSENMNPAEKILVGLGGGLRNTYLGAKNLVGLGTEEDRAERELWDKSKKDLGGWGTAGEIGGDIVSTMPLGGPVAQGAKVLVRALPWLSKVANVGGRVVNLGTAGRAAAEGALSAGIVGDAQDRDIRDRLDNVAAGGATGFVAPAVLGAGSAVANKVRRELSPSVAQATQRGYSVLERTLGKDQLADVINQVENPVPSLLPRTTAAMTQNPRMGALERGARSRGNVDFAPHDRAVAERSWDLTKQATRVADDLPVLERAPGEMMEQGKAILDKLPLSQDRRALIGRELVGLRNTNEVIANPALAREIDTAIAAMDNPDATLGVLPQLYWAMGREAGGSTAIQRARDVIKNVADERSGGQFSNLQAGYGVAMDQLKGAKAAQGIRDTFQNSQTGFPNTRQYFGDAGQGAVPVVDSTTLRRSINKAPGEVTELPQGSLDRLGTLADQLRSHEIYQPAMSSGSTGVNKGGVEGIASAALNAGPLWRLRGALGSVFGGLNEKSQKAIDQALLDPQAFLNMVEAKRALSRPLEPWEATLEGVVRGMSRSAAISTGD